MIARSLIFSHIYEMHTHTCTPVFVFYIVVHVLCMAISICYSNAIYVRIFFGSIDDQNLIVHAGMGLPPVEYGQVITMIYLKVAIYASPRLPSPCISLPLLCVCTCV